MNKCKIIIAGLLCLIFTGCEDFLDRPSLDKLSMEDYCKTAEEMNTLTATLYGGKVWFEYQDKFAWCAHELMSGNVYHEFGPEGQFFFFTIEETNTIMTAGYTSLNAVISRANGLINNMPASALANGVDPAVVKRGVAEAKMYRGMALFLLTELFGEVPVVLDNAKVIAENSSSSVPRAKREFIFKLIEQDWLYAADNLPDAPWGEGWRVTKSSANGMLAKLYLTMASCQNSNVALYDGAGNADENYRKAKEYAKKVLDVNGSLDPSYANLFAFGQRTNNESLFALQFFEGEYGVGSSRQIQFARSKVWNGGMDQYGGGKGLSVTLFESFDEKDVRLKETSLYSDGTQSNVEIALPGTGKLQKLNNPVYYLESTGEPYGYFINPGGQFPTGAPFGTEDVSFTLNSIKKYVYGHTPLGDKFSCPMRMDFLRVADVMLIYAEADMCLNNGGDVTKPVSGEAVQYVNEVRRRAGLDGVSSIALCVPEIKKTRPETAEDDNQSVTFDYSYFEHTYDLMQERRHEFTLECQSWLDLKRLAYQNEAKAKEFVEQQDRQWAFKQKFGMEGTPTVREDYERQNLIFMKGKALGYTDAEMPVVDEKKVFFENMRWFLPLPLVVLNGSPMLKPDQPANAFEGALNNQDEFGRFPNYPF